MATYTTIYEVRVEAGLQQIYDKASRFTVEGDIDGNNTVFFIDRPIVTTASNHDNITVADIKVFVDDVEVTVSNVTSNTFTLATAPATGSQLYIVFESSPVTNDYVSKIIAQCTSWIDGYLKKAGFVLPFNDTDNKKPEAIGIIASLWCAGILLIRDYGSSTDTDGTSKDGYKKITLAEKMLKDFVENNGISIENDTISNEVYTAGDEPVFGRHSKITEEDYFMRGF